MSRRMPMGPRSGPTRRTVMVVRAVKAGAASALAGTAIVLTLNSAFAGPGLPAPRSTAPAAPAHDQGRCTDAGGRAVVRTALGEVRTVPFERAWRIYRGKQAGTLVAVCPD